MNKLLFMSVFFVIFKTHAFLANGEVSPFPMGTTIECQSPKSEETRIFFKIQVSQPVTNRLERSHYTFEGHSTFQGRIDHVLNSESYCSGQYPVYYRDKIVVFINEADPHITYFSAEFDPLTMKSTGDAWGMFYDRRGHFQNLECTLQLP